jgi:hypothetical protein
VQRVSVPLLCAITLSTFCEFNFNLIRKLKQVRLCRTDTLNAVYEVVSGELLQADPVR